MAYFSTLKIEAACSSETSVTFNGLNGVIFQKILQERCAIKINVSVMTKVGNVAIPTTNFWKVAVNSVSPNLQDIGMSMYLRGLYR
jgi:hypothetical protein